MIAYANYRVACSLLALLLCAVPFAASCNRPAKTSEAHAPLQVSADPTPLISVEHVGDFCSRWYSQQLAALEEPSLDPKLCRDPRGESCRFLWLRTFDPPVAVRIDRNTDGATLYLKEADGKGGYSPGKLRRSESRKLTEREWQSVLVAIDEGGFWKMPSEPVCKIVLENGVIECRGGSDGAKWILEVTKGDTYHVVSRNNPCDDRFNKDQAYRECCLLILSLSKLDVPPDKLY
jgi:hypothetical protein